MLQEERALLAAAATMCLPEVRGKPNLTKREWHKFDLMLVTNDDGGEWWRSTPLITIEHEDKNDIEHEVWKLACWRSLLKVLITYHDSPPKNAAKLQLSNEIISRAELASGRDSAEWLFISADRTWPRETVLTWFAWERPDGRWEPLP